MEKFEDGAAPPSVDLVQCEFCKRRFLPKVWEKHTKNCQKSAAKKRTVFDSRKQRSRGFEVSDLKPNQPKAEPPKEPSNWHENHEDLISTIQTAKTVTPAMKDGKPLPPPPPPTYDPDYIKCPYCQQRFNESAADGHIEICKEKSARTPNKDKPGEAKKLAGSTTYKHPASVNKTNTPIVMMKEEFEDDEAPFSVDLQGLRRSP
uniref:Zinc finger C2HC domain-containing protein 1A n=1 Tax=Gouania willdenowi TaxID=441366 RepID=A0A8C5DNU1_GOUWI